MSQNDKIEIPQELNDEFTQFLKQKREETAKKLQEMDAFLSGVTTKSMPAPVKTTEPIVVPAVVTPVTNVIPPVKKTMRDYVVAVLKIKSGNFLTATEISDYIFKHFNNHLLKTANEITTEVALLLKKDLGNDIGSRYLSNHRIGYTFKTNTNRPTITQPLKTAQRRKNKSRTALKEAMISAMQQLSTFENVSVIADKIMELNPAEGWDIKDVKICIGKMLSKEVIAENPDFAVNTSSKRDFKYRWQGKRGSSKDDVTPCYFPMTPPGSPMFTNIKNAIFDIIRILNVATPEQVYEKVAERIPNLKQIHRTKLKYTVHSMMNQYTKVSSKTQAILEFVEDGGVKIYSIRK